MRKVGWIDGRALLPLVTVYSAKFRTNRTARDHDNDNRKSVTELNPKITGGIL